MNFDKQGIANKQKKLSTGSTPVWTKLKVILLRLLILVVLAAIVLVGFMGFSIVKGVVNDAPDITSADVKPQGYTTFVLDNQGNEIERFIAENANRVWVDIEQMPEYTQHAFVAIEDSRFYEHNGIDLPGIARAFVVGVSQGFHFSEGASTITQQLIKNTVYPDFVNEGSFKESLTRKIQEQYLALELEKTMTKDEVLENYLNTINLGQNSLGIQTAAQRYFGKSVSELTISESAVIAAITQNPSKYNPIRHPEDNADRREKVLRLMCEQGYITEAEKEEALADDVYSRIQTTNAAITADTEESEYTYYVDELTEQVIDDLQTKLGYSYTQAYNALYSGGLTIKACQDATIQQIVDEEMENPNNYPGNTYYSVSYAATVYHTDDTYDNYYTETMVVYMKQIYGDGFENLFNSPEEAQACVDSYKAAIVGEGDEIVDRVTIIPQPQASIVIMDQYTGEVKAIAGGRGDKGGSLTLNRATNTTRQPGSCFKVLSTYAPAIDCCGYTLATPIKDEPFYYDSGRQVHNWWGDSMYYGEVSVRKAIEQSMNVCAVKTLTAITPRVGYNYLLNFGFTTLVDGLELEDGTVLTDVVQPLALGGITYGITNLEITAAYATIANNGTYTKPRFYSQILDHEGNVLIDNTPETHKVLNEYTAQLLTNAMQDVVTQGTGSRARLSSLPVSGKTGTTTDNADIWFSGYTPYYTCSVWGGFDENQEMSNTSWHLTLWRSIMERVSAGQEYQSFYMSPDLKRYSVCSVSGMLPVEGSCQTISEYFAPGTAPSGTCTGHGPKEETLTLTPAPKKEEPKELEDPDEPGGDEPGGDTPGGDTPGGDSGGGDSGGGTDTGGGTGTGGESGTGGGTGGGGGWWR